MILQLNPILDGLQAARIAAGDAVHANDEVTVEDRDSLWVFEFLPKEEVLGGGARVTVNKADFRIHEVVRYQ